jgi:large subunit ribosomal protein L29
VPNAAELRELDDDELELRLTEYRRELLNLRFQLATGQLDNVSRMGVVRKDVARVLGILRDREIHEAEAAGLEIVPTERFRAPRRQNVVASTVPEKRASIDRDEDVERAETETLAPEEASPVTETAASAADTEENE